MQVGWGVLGRVPRLYTPRRAWRWQHSTPCLRMGGTEENFHMERRQYQEWDGLYWGEFIKSNKNVKNNETLYLTSRKELMKKEKTRMNSGVLNCNWKFQCELMIFNIQNCILYNCTNYKIQFVFQNTNKYKRMCVSIYTCIYSLVLSSEGNWKQWCTNCHEHNQVFLTKLHLPLKGIQDLWQIVRFQAWSSKRCIWIVCHARK